MKTVYEFYGSIFHGCPRCYSKDDKNPLAKKLMSDLHDYTIKRETNLKAMGYSVVSIWESQFAPKTGIQLIILSKLTIVRERAVRKVLQILLFWRTGKARWAWAQNRCWSGIRRLSSTILGRPAWGRKWHSSVCRPVQSRRFWLLGTPSAGACKSRSSA